MLLAYDRIAIFTRKHRYHFTIHYGRYTVPICNNFKATNQSPFLMQQGNSTHINSLKWFVLVVKTKREKQVAEILERHGFEIYCPVKKEV